MRTFLVLSALDFLLKVHMSLRNLVYVGISLIATRRGRLTLTCLNVSTISSLCLFYLEGKGASKAYGKEPLTQRRWAKNFSEKGLFLFFIFWITFLIPITSHTFVTHLIIYLFTIPKNNDKFRKFRYWRQKDT